MWSVYNVTKGTWATSTNYTTRREAQALLNMIEKAIPFVTYEVRKSYGKAVVGKKGS